MGYVKASGVVLRRTKVGENDAILTVFTDSLGVIKVSAKGIKSLKNKSFAGAALFSYSEFVLRPKKDEFYYLHQADLKMSFYNLSTNIERLAYATYIADITCYAYSDALPEPRALSLLLNTFYLLANSKDSLSKIKSVYELKTLFYAGEGVWADSCIVCGRKEDISHFSNEGGCVCSLCKNEVRSAQKISPACLSAIRYINSSEDKKAFSFKAAESVLSELGYFAESFFTCHMEKDFYSLKYLNTVIGKDTKL